MSNFTDRIQLLKINKKLLQKEIAKAVGISVRTYQRYETGERTPDTDTLIKLADYFDVSTDYLLGRTDDPKRY